MIQDRVNQLLGITALGVRGLQKTYEGQLDRSTANNRAVEAYESQHPGATKIETYRDEDIVMGTQVDPEVHEGVRQQANTGGSIRDLQRGLSVEQDIAKGNYLTRWHQDIGEIQMEEEGRRQVQQKQEFEQLLESLKKEPTSFGVPVGQLPPKMQEAAIAAMLKSREEENNG